MGSAVTKTSPDKQKNMQRDVHGDKILKTSLFLYRVKNYNYAHEKHSYFELKKHTSILFICIYVGKDDHKVFLIKYSVLM